MQCTSIHCVNWIVTMSFQSWCVPELGSMPCLCPVQPSYDATMYIWIYSRYREAVEPFCVMDVHLLHLML